MLFFWFKGEHSIVFNFKKKNNNNNCSKYENQFDSMSNWTVR